MHIGVPTETRTHETRVAATPETVQKYVSQGHYVTVQMGAGTAATFPDEAYIAVGAQMTDAATAFGADIVLKVHSPNISEMAFMKRGAVLIGMLDPLNDMNTAALVKAGLTAFSLEAAPRTTRAQSLDVLSSQANIAGYKAVLIAANLYPRFMPMLMTAAGTVKAARMLVLGAGVAGLQAIATARRLGAVIEAFDARLAVKEQIESLGGKFFNIPYETQEEREAAESVSGYARSMPPSWLARQSLLIHERIKYADIVISTALTPGCDAPTLLPPQIIKTMKPGSVVIDLAAGRGPTIESEGNRRGGNCPLTEPDKIITKHGITIVGYTNLASMLPADASSLYARNLLNFLQLIITKEATLNINFADDIVAATLLACDTTITKKV